MPRWIIVVLQASVDTMFMQGRFSFYMTSNGEEATAIGSAAALTLEDVVRVCRARRAFLSSDREHAGRRLRAAL